MNDFDYRDDELFCEGVPLARIAEAAGTPCYVYSKATLTHHFEVFDRAFGDVPHLTCFAVKANSSLALLHELGRLGAGADIVSGGELYRALAAGIPASKIVYSGVGKTGSEITYALESDIRMFNVESDEELRVLDDYAGRLSRKARISLRINPDIDPKVHPYIATGLSKSKFGIDIDRSLAEYRAARELRNIEIVGVDCHIGSQVTELSPFIDALKRLKLLVDALRVDGMAIGYLDLGGGLGITYDAEAPPHPAQYARAVLDEVRGWGVTLVLEPGRVIVGNAGVLLSRVLYRKATDRKNFLVVDGGMNDLIRPSLYGAFHAIRPVRRSERPDVIADVVGPVCESGDFFAKDRAIPLLERGELIAVMSAGAYGFTMSSNYNSRPRAPEVMVSGDCFEVIRAREDYDDLVARERIPTFPCWKKGHGDPSA
jgi:diaminopimelate decarboxylase